jgi:hypothetical protein
MKKPTSKINIHINTLSLYSECQFRTKKKLQLKIVSDSINTSIKEGKYIVEGKVN